MPLNLMFVDEKGVVLGKCLDFCHSAIEEMHCSLPLFQGTTDGDGSILYAIRGSQDYTQNPATPEKGDMAEFGRFLRCDRP